VSAEAELVRAAQAGERAAFDALALKHAAALVRTAYVILGRQDEAEDVAQETLIAAYRNLGSYRHDAPFGAWLHRIAVNRSYDHIRRRRRQSQLVDDLTSASSGSDEDNAVREARAGELRAEVRELIAGLDEKNRAIVALRFLEDMPIKEIAATLDMPEGTVKRRLHEVIKILRTRLAEGATR
jgi:RNA polymerase sigma-70 factor (ECF subfamily)